MQKNGTKYRLRAVRQRRRARAFRLRRQLELAQDNTRYIGRRDILLFATIYNELHRLDYFLEYYRELGIRHFFFIDNNSTDGTFEYLRGQSDITVYQTSASYKRSHFGMDWINWLLYRHGRGKWCLTVDADEFFIYPHSDYRKINALTDWLDTFNQQSFPSMLIDMYPEKPISKLPKAKIANPFDYLTHFDAGNYYYHRNPDYRNLWIQGGVRMRAFFKDAPDQAPALNKTPLVKWKRGNVYISSTHTLLPRSLNETYETNGGELISGAILHTKFLPDIKYKALNQKLVDEHYSKGREYKTYEEKALWEESLVDVNSVRYEGWEQLEALGLISLGGWA